MCDYGTLRTWVDYKGRTWRVVTATSRLKFKYPAHAALREHVFVMDGFKCRRCPARALAVPDGWNGRFTLPTNTYASPGYRDALVADHVLTLKAGGRNEIANFQTLCETCNRRKQKEDIAAIKAYQLRAA